MRPADAPGSNADLNEQERFALRNARTISIALIVGVLLFGAVVAGLSLSGSGNAAPIRPPSLANVPSQVVLLAGMAGLMLFTAVPAAFFMRRVMLARAADPETGRVDPGAFVTGNLIAFALIEAPALLALVSCLIGRSLWPGGVIALLAVLVMIAFVPRAAHLSIGRSRDEGIYGYREPEKWG